ncbi:Uncharacterised protein [Mycobacteroides abscessus subsp. abscessus]|nr:Uncharacterised protein [Mycobacteroides abscessus subsp. abscessus]
MWGVDDGPQPDTYDDFERYLENVERNHLVRSQVTECESCSHWSGPPRTRRCCAGLWICIDGATRYSSVSSR